MQRRDLALWHQSAKLLTFDVSLDGAVPKIGCRSAGRLFIVFSSENLKIIFFVKCGVFLLTTLFFPNSFSIDSCQVFGGETLFSIGFHHESGGVIRIVCFFA